MKRIVAIASVALLGVSALTSCKKDYVCTYDGVTVSECTACNKTSKDAFDINCSLLGGTVSEK